MATVNYFTQVALLAAAIAATGCDTDGQETIGPRGGVITSPDGRVTLEVPAGALDHEVSISIGEVDHGPDGTIGTAYEIEPKFTTFAVPATLTFDLADTGSADGSRTFNLADAGMELADVTLVSEKSSGWEAVADIRDDEDAMLLSGSVVFLSTYAVVPRD